MSNNPTKQLATIQYMLDGVTAAKMFPEVSFQADLPADQHVVRITASKPHADMIFYSVGMISGFTVEKATEGLLISLVEQTIKSCVTEIEQQIVKYEKEHAAAGTSTPPSYWSQYTYKDFHTPMKPIQANYEYTFSNEPQVIVGNKETIETYKKIFLPKYYPSTPFKPHKPKELKSLVDMYTPPKPHKPKPKTAKQMKAEAEAAKAGGAATMGTLEAAANPKKSFYQQMEAEILAAEKQVFFDSIFTATPLSEYLKSTKIYSTSSGANFHSEGGAQPAQGAAAAGEQETDILLQLETKQNTKD